MPKAKKKSNNIAFCIIVFVVVTIVVYLIRMSSNPSAASSSWSAGSEFGHSMWVATVATFIAWIIKRFTWEK